MDKDNGMNASNNLEEARSTLIAWKEQMKDLIELSSNCLTNKPIFELEYFSESVFYRFIELAEATFILLEAQNYLGSVVTVRSLQETSAVIWYLNEKCLYAVENNDLTHFSEQMKRLMLGWKHDNEFPEAINVLNLIDKVDNKISGYRKHYDLLSEYVHPNWHGTMGLFAKTGGKEPKVEFGRYIRGKNVLVKHIEAALITSIDVVMFIQDGYEDTVKKLADLCYLLKS
jgi:hypothetical protein